ncbi:TetR/AcrR family transcriptional regulator [Achromobacter xylosoxidans]|uniref:TetR/AcrR family transcriptional regulator n=1 Tax=Alcaligenes xylosoxydans xylosoxydans TaxID=85698 RepID=UPI001F136AA5
MDLLHSEGYNATGIKEIVDAAGVPKGSFYNHFESKEAFGAEVVNSYFSSGWPELERLLTNPEMPPLARLRTYFISRRDIFGAGEFTRGCMLGNMSLEVADHSEQVRDRLAVHFETWAELLERCIVEAKLTGAIKNPANPAALARFVLNSWEGALLRMRVDKSTAPLDDFIEIVFSFVLV